MRMISWLTPPVDEKAFLRWRGLTGLVTAGYLVVRARHLTTTTDVWEPMALLRSLDGPLPNIVLWVLWVAALIGCVEWMWRATPVRFVPQIGAIAFVLLLSHRSSIGQILWFDILPALHVAVLAAAGTRFDPIRAGWAVRLASIVTVVTYVLAGIAKLRFGGLEWVAEGSLERSIAFSSARFDALGGTASPVASLLTDLGPGSTLLSIGVILIELGAPIVLFSRRSAWLWSIAAWLMHLVIAATMFVVFFWPLFGLAFMPLVLLGHGNDRSARH